jgi:hypothetical protein
MEYLPCYLMVILLICRQYKESLYKKSISQKGLKYWKITLNYVRKGGVYERDLLLTWFDGIMVCQVDMCFL